MSKTALVKAGGLRVVLMERSMSCGKILVNEATGMIKTLMAKMEEGLEAGVLVMAEV